MTAQYIVDGIVDRIVKETDDLVLSVLAEHGITEIGPHLKERLHKTRVQGTNFETLYLDGKPILRLYDIEYENVEQPSGSHTLNISRKYAKF